MKSSHFTLVQLSVLLAVVCFFASAAKAVFLNTQNGIAYKKKSLRPVQCSVLHSNCRAHLTKQKISPLYISYISFSFLSSVPMYVYVVFCPLSRFVH